MLQPWGASMFFPQRLCTNTRAKFWNYLEMIFTPCNLGNIQVHKRNQSLAAEDELERAWVRAESMHSSEEDDAPFVFRDDSSLETLYIDFHGTLVLRDGTQL